MGRNLTDSGDGHASVRVLPRSFVTLKSHMHSSAEDEAVEQDVVGPTNAKISTLAWQSYLTNRYLV
jgi:hypothetical protein